VQRYRDFEKARRLDQLEPEIRFCVEELIHANGGKLPQLRLPPGRRRNEHEKMLIHLAVLQELEALGPGRGNVSKAIAALVKGHRPHKGRRYVEDIFYKRDPSSLSDLSGTGRIMW
jgi:hypothetical protein